MGLEVVGVLCVCVGGVVVGRRAVCHTLSGRSMESAVTLMIVSPALLPA